MSVTPKSNPKARTPPGVEIPTGTVLGHYRVLSELGRGGMGVVYRAEDLQRGGTVALKTLLWGDPAAMLRFKQEFRAIADITHRNLATLFELASEGERLFFTMELIEGVDFAEWVKADPERLRPALVQLAQGLSALHAAGRIHRDLKPPNVRVARDGRVVILDFGLAATLGRDGAHQSTILAAKGTPAYMAPEQAQGKPVTPACDWYSVGVMLYEAIAARSPFEGAGLDVLLTKQEAPPPLSDFVPDVPEDLDSLCAALLQREPQHRPDGATVLRRLQAEEPARPSAEVAAEATPAIVGREGHLQELRDAFEALRKRRPVMVFAHGYSGMGKTTLVQSFLEEVTRNGEAVVLEGKCYERESVPYKALDGPIDALARYLGRLPHAEAGMLLPRDVHSIARVFPVLRKVEAIAQAPPPSLEIPDPQEVRRRAFAGLRETFARIADRVPLVVCVDDLQWGDTDSADMLASILRPPEAPAFLFVGCYRREDADASAFLGSIRQPGRELPDAREIRVDPLSRNEATDLAGLLLGGDVPADRAAAIARESGGSPFFVRELAAFGETIGGETEAVTLEEVLRRRIRTLPAGAGALLEVVAVAGGPVPRATAAFAARLEEGAPASMMAALRSTRLVRVTSSETGEELDTYHDRVRETVVAGLAEDHRRQLHLRLGHALEAEPDVDPEVLGLHFEGAGDARRAGRHYVHAAEEAHRALAFDHAARLYRKALELLSPTGEQRRDLLRHLADALADGGRGPEAGHVYLEAAEGAAEVESLELRSRAAHQFLVSGLLEEGETVIGPVERELGIRLPKSPLGAFLKVVRDLAWLRLRGLRHRTRDPSTIPRIDALRLEVLHTRASTLGGLDPLQGIPYQTHALRLALKLGHPLLLSMAISRHAAYESVTDVAGSRRVERMWRIGELLAKQAGVPLAHAYLDLSHGMCFYIMGRWASAAESHLKAGRRFREECVGSWWERHFAEFYRLICLDLLGRFHELRSAVDLHLRDAEDRGHLFMETDLRLRILYLGSLMRDAPAEAQEGVDRAFSKWTTDKWSFQRWRWTDATVQVALYRGDSASGRDFLAHQWPAYRRTFMTRVPTVSNFMDFARDRLELAVAADLPQRARTRSLVSKTARLGKRLEKARDTYAQGWGLLVRAGAANVCGDVGTALRHLEAAEANFTEAEMAAYRAVTRRRRGELIGGDEGRALIAESDGWLEKQGVQDPVAWARMYAPGFEE